MSGSRYFVPYAYAYDPTGGPVPGAQLFFYVGDSSTLATTYADVGLTTPNTNPVIADDTGTFPSIFLDPAVTYKVILEYGAASSTPGQQIWSAFPVNGTTGTNLNSYSATGTNAIVLTPLSNTASISAYSNYQEFVFVAPATTTGAVTIQVGSLGILPLYLNGVQASSGSLTAGQLVNCFYVNGVFVMLPSLFALPQIVIGSDIGSTNAYSINPTPAITTYTNTIIKLSPANTNTGGSTINVSGLGAVAILDSTASALVAGMLQAGGQYLLAYDGVHFRLINGLVPASSAQVLAGTDNVQAITSLALKQAIAASSANPGLFTLPGGVLTFRFGQVNVPGSGQATVNYGTGLPTGALCALATPIDSTAASGFAVDAVGATSMIIHNANGSALNFYWLVIGY